MIVNKNKIFYWFCALFAIIIVANRGNTRDTLAYHQIFDRIFEYPIFHPIEFYNSSNVEIGFGLLLYFVRSFSNSSSVAFLLISFLSFYFIYRIIDYISRDYSSKVYTYSVLLYISSAYFFMQQFMQIRQGLAIPCAIFAILSLLDKNYVKFIIFSIMSISIHQSAIAIVFFGGGSVFFVNRNKMSIQRFKLFLVLMIMVAILLSKFILLEFIVSLSDRLVAYSYSIYSHNTSVFRLPNIKSFIVLILILFLLNKSLYYNKLFIVFLFFYSFSFIFRIGFSDFAILSGRLGAVFGIVEIFILSMLLFRFKNLRGGIFSCIIVIQAIITYVYQAPYILEDYFKPLY